MIIYHQDNFRGWTLLQGREGTQDLEEDLGEFLSLERRETLGGSTSNHSQRLKEDLESKEEEGRGEEERNRWSLGRISEF